jgi:ABC-type sugar transport system permease subunit
VIALTARKNRLETDPVGYALIVPYYLFIVIFVFIPILYNIVLSFTNYDLTTNRFVGLKNYRVMITDAFFWISVKNTMVYTFFTLLFAMGLGLVTAVLLNRKLLAVRLIRTGFFTPYVTSMVAVSMIWLWIYEPSHGIANSVLGWFHVTGKQWLYDVRWALFAVILMSVWKFVGYNMVIYLAGLQSVPSHLYEAAAIDGAGFFRSFFHITVPLLRPVTFFLLVTGVINNFNVFEQIQILTNGGPMNATTTIVHQIYNRAFNEFQMGYAAALSTVLLAMIGGMTLIHFKFGSRSHEMD